MRYNFVNMNRKKNRISRYVYNDPALLSRPCHKATAEEAKEFWDWANQPWNADRLEKIKRIDVQVRCDIENALQFSPVRPGENSPVFVGAFLPGRRPLQITPMLNADYKARVRLTYMGQEDDSRLYIALMSLTYGKPMRSVRECAACRKGFVALHGRDRFCSTLCRVKWHAQTEEGKRKRAEYMRNYRATLRQREQRQQPKGYQRKRGRKLHGSLMKGE